MQASKREEGDCEPAPLWCSCRLTLALISFLGFVNLYALRVNMSVAMVCMVKNDFNSNGSDIIMEGNQSEVVIDECPAAVNAERKEGGEFLWEKKTQGFVLSSFFWGYTVTQLPGGWVAGRFGGKRLFGWSMLLCAVATLLTPVAARTSVGLLIALRVIAGLGQGVVWPSMQVLWANWAPPLERSKLSGFCYAGAQIGNVITFPVAGLLCEYGFDGGWPSIFYIQGSLGVVWFVAWMFLVADSPVSHPRITEREKNFLVHSLRSDIDVTKKLSTTPWLKIATSLPVWAIIVTHACANWGTYTFLTNIPSYMKEVLRFDIKSNGFLSALPYIGFWAMVNVSGLIADHLRSRYGVTTTTTRKLFNSLGLLLPALFVILTGLMDCSKPVSAVALLAIGVAMSGCQYGSGFIVNPVDIAPRYAGIIFGISNTTGTLGGFLAPIAIGIITVDKTREQWQIVFYIAAAIYSFGAVFYIIFGSGEIQQWAFEGSRDTTVDVTTLPYDTMELNTKPSASS